MLDWKVIRYIFKCLCIIATWVLVVMWVKRYLVDEDTSLIATRSYFDSEDDILPVMSLCFRQSFNDKLFDKFGQNITGLNYQKYLLGEYFDTDMTKVDYNSVTTNISDFLLGYYVVFINGSNMFEFGSNITWKHPYPPYTWVNWGRFIVKCFGLEITNKNISQLTTVIKRDIFPNGIRPQTGGFVVLFHYPNQVWSSLHSIMRQWVRRDNITNYWMDFNIKGIEVTAHRYKPRYHNCIQHWKNYDNIVLEEHIKHVGCKTPYHPTNYRWPLCTNQEKMKEAQFYPKISAIPPCRVIEAVDYQMLEDDSGEWGASLGKNWFGITLRILNGHFKILIQKEEVDFQTLVGYVGGYIGIFTGFALAQIPEVVLATFIYVKKLYARLYRRNLTDVRPIQESETQQSEDDSQTQIDDNIRKICNQITTPVKEMCTRIENKLGNICTRIDNMEHKIHSVYFLDQQMNQHNIY